MGMQCSFAAADLESTCETKTIHDIDSDTYTIEVIDPTGRTAMAFNLAGDSCWFDCGRATTDQLIKIKFLIHNRICFQCS